jgi:hypothetical protein
MDENASTPDPLTSPVDEPSEPAFEEYTLGELEEMLQKAFRDFVITDMNHPIAREMLGDNTNESTAL